MFLQEYCADGTLLEQLRKPSGYTADQALSWVRDVARGMEYLHGSRIQIAHRDLKPENILLCGGVAKVADFGLSRIVFDGGELREQAAPASLAAAPPAAPTRRTWSPPSFMAWNARWAATRC